MSRFLTLAPAGVLQAGGSLSEPLVLLYLAVGAAALGAAALFVWRRLRSRQLLEKRLAELSVLAEVGQAIAGAPPELQTLAEIVYRQAGQIVDTSRFQLGLFEGDRYRLLIWIVDGRIRPPQEFLLTPDGLGIVGWLRESRRSLLVRDFLEERDTLPAAPRYASLNPPRSAVFVPLLAGEAVIGAVVVQSRYPNTFTEEDRRLLTIIAGYAASALERGRLLEQAQRRAQQLQQLAEVTQQLNVLQPLPALYRQVVELASQKFGPYAVSYFENCGDELVLRATTRPAWREQKITVPFGEGVVGRAALAGEVQLLQDLPEYPRTGGEAVAQAHQADLAVPVEIDGRVLGVLDAQSVDGAALDDSTVSLFQSLAAQLAIAILEGQTYAAERRRADQLTAIAQTSRAIASNLDLADLLDEVLDMVDEHFGYDRARIFLLSEDQLVLRAASGSGTGAWAAAGLSYTLGGPGLIALAGRTGQPVRVDDVSADAIYRPGPGLEDTVSELAVPMLNGPRLLGVFDVQSPRHGAFSDEDVQTLQTLADTLGVAVRNVRLFEIERRRRRLAETLREVSAALTSTLHLDDVLDLILTGLARVVNYDSATVLLRNEAGEMILRAARGAPQAEKMIGEPLDVRLLPAGAALPATVEFHEVDHVHAYHDLLALPDPHACLGALLLLSGEPQGYLVVDRAGQLRFPQGEVELVAAFAAQAAVAIENARLYTSQREQAWISTALLQVAEATARATELQEVMDTVARLTPMLVGVDRCAMLLSDGKAFTLAAHHGVGEEPEGFALPPRTLPAEWPKLAELATTAEPVVMESDEAMPVAWRVWFGGVVIGLPLLNKGAVQGAMLVGQAPGDVAFTTHRIRLLSGIANQAALAIESALLAEAQQEEAWVSTALLQVAQAVANETSLVVGLETVARLTPLLVGIERVAIYQWDAVAQLFVPSQVVGFSPEAEAAITASHAQASDLGIQAEGDAAQVFGLTLPARLRAAFGFDHCLLWPLRARGDLLGALVVENVPMADRRLSILNGIAHQLALAMENARLSREVAMRERLEREIEVAQDIQASFLPDACPVFPGWEVCAFWRSARQVGGDFYDFIPLRSNDDAVRWGIVIADVSDKGVPAALYMALSRTLLRSVAIGRVSPAATLARVNDLILADARSEQFVTAFYGVWEPATGGFTYASAGHNPPVLARHDGRLQALDGQGIALGVLDGAEYREREIHLHPGDALVLYTDGLPDAINAAEEEFGMRRLEEVVRSARNGSAAALQDALTRAVQTHVGPIEAFDDMTLVVLKRAEE